MNSFYTYDELLYLGFKSLGHNVLISKKASFYGIERISIGNDVRIDDFSILSGNITIANYVHIGAYCALYGAYGIEMEDYSGLSPRCTVFSATDDFSGDFLISPMVSDDKTNVTGGKVLISKFAQIGAGCIVMPNLTIKKGAAVGAMSFVSHSLDEWSIYAGIPAIKIKERKKGLLNLIEK